MTSRGVSAAVLALAVSGLAGCDAEQGGRPEAAAPGAGGKADDAQGTGGDALGVTEIRVDINGDQFGEGDNGLEDYELFLNGVSVPANEWVEVPYTGVDCLSVVSKNPAGGELVTESCHDLTPDPELLDYILTVQPVYFDVIGDASHVDFGWGFGRLGLAGNQVMSAGDDGFVPVEAGYKYLVAPGQYSLTHGYYDELAAPETWQTVPVFIDEVSDYTGGFSFDNDVRTRITLWPPAEGSTSLPPARSDSGCQLSANMWVTTATENRSYERPLDEVTELFFMPYPGPSYELRVSGILVADDWRVDGEVAYEVGVDTYAHDVPLGPDGEGGSFAIWPAGDPTSPVQCYGGTQFGSGSTFEVGTHVSLPAGDYVERIDYDGLSPIERPFTVG